MDRPEDRLELRAAEGGERSAAAQLQDGHGAQDYTTARRGDRARPACSASA
jgi:hypothetical protein